MTRPQILHLKPFSLDIPHGGAHRAEQISDMLSRFHIDTLIFESPQSQKTRPIRDRLKGTIYALQDQDWEAFQSHRIGYIGRSIRAYEAVLSSELEFNLILWELTSNSVISKLASKYQKKLIALPQNIEAFWKVKYSQKDTSGIYQSLRCEINSFKMADAVFTISLEETIFLRNFGVNAEYLPYYPSSRLLQNLLNIRRERENSRIEKHSFLILGSVINPFTIDGMVEVVNWLKDLGLQQLFDFQIAGRNTEIFRDLFDEPWLKILGTVSNDELEKHLCFSRAVLVHQIQGHGFLTKIPEMLIAGIPVIANEIAARSAQHLQGVHVYGSPEELKYLLTQDFNPVPIPPRPELAEKKFIGSLYQCLL